MIASPPPRTSAILGSTQVLTSFMAQPPAFYMHLSGLRGHRSGSAAVTAPACETGTPSRCNRVCGGAGTLCLLSSSLPQPDRQHLAYLGRDAAVDWCVG